MKNKFSCIIFAIAGCLSITYASDNLECNSAQDCEKKAHIALKQEKDPKKYIQYLTKACKDYKRCFGAILAYTYGTNVEPSYAKAVELLKVDPLDSNHLQALAYIYTVGDSTLKPDKSKAIKYLRIKCAIEHDDVSGYCERQDIWKEYERFINNPQKNLFIKGYTPK